MGRVLFVILAVVFVPLLLIHVAAELMRPVSPPELATPGSAPASPAPGSR